MQKSEYKQAVAEMAKTCYREGLFSGTSGNLSLYDPENGLMYITPGSFPYDSMTADDIAVVNLADDSAEGPHRPSSEWRVHATVYRDKPEVTAIVHTHSPYATSFAVARQPIPAIMIELVGAVGTVVPVAPFIRPGIEELGHAIADTLGDGGACLLASHGVVAVGSTS